MPPPDIHPVDVTERLRVLELENTVLLLALIGMSLLAGVFCALALLIGFGGG